MSVSTPEAEASLAAALDVMETIGLAEFRSVAEPAERAERLASELGRTDLQMRARLVRADVFRREGDTAAAGRAAHEVNAWASEHEDAYLLARSHHVLSHFFRQIGDLADALAHAVQAVTHTGDDVPARIRARHLANLATVLHENESLDEARRRFRDALDIATGVGDVDVSMDVLNNMAYLAYLRGDADEARELADRMRMLAARHGAALDASDLDTIARVETMHGRYDIAEETLSPILDGAAGHLLTEGDALAQCLLTVAEAQRLRGDIEAAQASLERAARICDERDLMSVRAEVREEQARLYAATGRYREAYEEHLRFHEETLALMSAQREARARALQAVFETEEARRESLRFREMAQRDALTGLYNRRYVDECLATLLDRATERGSPLSVALVDLDHFKRINDTLSHAAGDAVLTQVARLLADAASDHAASDGDATDQPVAARLGGEEFVLIFPGVDLDEAMRRCERLRRSIAAHPWRPVTGDLPVTASVGVAAIADERPTPSALLARADRNLYAAKRSGRNRVIGDPGDR
ncbi:diguanylate cyclase [Planosporangium thailandense]|uniref:Diguanylate cyclase n=2 Tax=Planosporangium thailandense TaxID=765197 RepID=A0ABX0XXR6_9ACTN|nr:diguanylate cyclase [Planosporangium thailandense]